MTEGPADATGRTPAQAVREYIGLKRDWEVSTAERVTGLKRGDKVLPDSPFELKPEALEAAMADLSRLRRLWCTPAAVERLDPHASFGSTSEFNPDGLVVLSVHQPWDDQVTLRTREYPFDVGLPSEYEYALRLIDGGWR